MSAEYLHADPEIYRPISELGIAKPDLYERLLTGEITIPLQGVELDDGIIVKGSE